MPDAKPQRACGILLHISSLPSRYGIGDLGPDAHAFAETMAAAGLKYWQFLPLTPTSTFIGNSPYSSPSAFAGNPLFISPEYLLEDGFISQAELEMSLEVRLPEQPGAQARQARDAVLGNHGRVDFAAVSAQREFLLNTAFDLLLEKGIEPGNLPGFKEFTSESAYWLDDYALFAALKEAHGGAGWLQWPDELKWRDPASLESWRGAHRNSVERQKFIQYLFNRQWNRLHERCRSLGVNLVGDMPIYVTHDSADVWTRPDLYHLGQHGEPTVVAGVPPDYFSETGQRWGNPVYNWSAMRKESFQWWIQRLERSLRQADLVRLDHFRGFCAYWEIPAEEENAVKGRWVEAPGRDLFTALRQHFGYSTLPIIAEDLGIITPDVRELMEDFELPGMKVLQFGFDGEPGSAPDAPFRHPRRSLVYTGTHDNPPTKQWFAEAGERERTNFIRYRGQDMDPELANEVLMRMALESQAHIAVLPMQDVLRLGAEARMNIPSLAEGNWSWRLTDKAGWLNAGHWTGNCAPGWADPALNTGQDGQIRQTGQTGQTGPGAVGSGPQAGLDPETPVPMEVNSEAYPVHPSARLDAPENETGDVKEEPAACAPPVPDVFGHVHFLCELYGRLEDVSK